MENPRLPYLREKTHTLPLEPGVYIMHEKSGKVIYVGKAKKLKNRVTSISATWKSSCRRSTRWSSTSGISTISSRTSNLRR